VGERSRPVISPVLEWSQPSHRNFGRGCTGAQRLRDIARSTAASFSASLLFSVERRFVGPHFGGNWPKYVSPHVPPTARIINDMPVVAELKVNVLRLDGDRTKV
jgi:hypothetical protein